MNLTAAEAAERIGVSRATITRLCQSGALEGSWKDSWHQGRLHIPDTAVSAYVIEREKALRKPRPYKPRDNSISTIRPAKKPQD